MNAGAADAAVQLARGLGETQADHRRECRVCDSFTALPKSRRDHNSKIALSAQNMYPKNDSAYTARFLLFLKDCGCRYVILGHSGGRLRESTEHQRKVKCAVAHVIPIMCIGETEQEREAGKTEAVETTCAAAWRASRKSK